MIREADAERFLTLRPARLCSRVAGKWFCLGCPFDGEGHEWKRQQSVFVQFKIHNLVFFFLPLLFVQISFCACTLSLFYAFVAVKIHLNIGLTTLKALYIQNWNFTHKVKKDQQSTSTQWEPIVVMSPFCMRPEDLTVQDVDANRVISISSNPSARLLLPSMILFFLPEVGLQSLSPQNPLKNTLWVHGHRRLLFNQQRVEIVSSVKLRNNYVNEEWFAVTVRHLQDIVSVTSVFGVGLSLQTCTVWKAAASCVSGRTNPRSASKIRTCHYNKHTTSQRTPFSYSQIQSHPIILSPDFGRLCLELPSPSHEVSALHFSCLKWLGCVFCSRLLRRPSSAVQHPGTVKRGGTAAAVLFITQMHDRRSHDSPTATCNQMYWGVTRETIFGAARNHNPSNGSFHA